MEEKWIEVVDNNGNKYRVNPIDLSSVTEIETSAKRGFKYFGRVARTFKEIPERMSKLYYKAIELPGKVGDKFQERKDKNFIEKDLEAMEKVINKNKEELNALIRGERAKLERELGDINQEIDGYTDEINRLEAETSKLNQDAGYQYCLSQIKSYNQQLTKSRIMLEGLEKQKRQLAASNTTSSRLDDEILKLNKQLDKLSREKTSLEKDRDKYLKENGLTDNLPYIDKLKQARADYNANASKLNGEITVLRNTTVDNIDDILPSISNVKIQKLYKTIKKQENMRDMRIEEQEKLLKDTKIDESEEISNDIPLLCDKQLKSDPTNEILAAVAEEMSADVSAIDNQSPIVSNPTADISTVSNDIDVEQSSVESEMQQSTDDYSEKILNPVNVPNFNPDDNDQEQQLETVDNISPVFDENTMEIEESSKNIPTAKEEIKDDDTVANTSERIEDVNIDGITWDDFSETSKASELVTEFKKAITNYNSSAITIVQNIFGAAQKYNQEQLDRVNASYKKVSSENALLRQQLNISQNENNALKQDINSKNQEITLLHSEIEETKQKYTSLLNELQIIKQSIAPLAALAPSLAGLSQPVMADEYQPQPEAAVAESSMKR